jgi:hypothetical protein
MADRAVNLAGFNLVDAYFRVFRAFHPPVFLGPQPGISDEGTLDSGDLIDYNRDRASIIGTDVVMSVTLGGIVMPDSTVVRVTGANKIIETDMNGQDGTFKELWSKADYLVTLRGFIVQQDGSDDYPKDRVRELRELCDAQESLEVECAQLNVFGIERLAIYDSDFPEMVGMPGMQAFELRCKSDRIFELELKTGGEA